MSITSIFKIFIALALVATIASCERNPQSTGRAYMPDMMYSQAYETYYATPPIGKDSSRISERIPVKGTIPVGVLPVDSLDRDWATHESYLYRTYFPESDTGSYERAGKELKNPLPYNDETKALGQKVFNINCTPCHGAAGDGQGSIVKSGAYPPVPAYKDRLPTINEGKMFHSITYGKNLMGSYASQVTPKERWAVIYYIQQLAGLNPGAKNAPVQTASAETGKNKKTK